MFSFPASPPASTPPAPSGPATSTRTMQDSWIGRCRTAARRGFTLAETMMATAVFSIVALGVYSVLIKSYQLVTLARYQDEARAVLQTFADQFERLKTTDSDSYTRWLFNPADNNGSGLLWGSVSAESTQSDATTSASGLVISLGGANNGIPATVTRTVKQISPSSGADQSGAYTAAGYLLRGTFTIRYTASGKAQTQSLTVVRAVP